MHTYMLPMSRHEKEAKIVTAMHEALTAFEINTPRSNFKITADHTTKHRNSWTKWGATSSSAFINAELALNPHLLEFVSYCAAAETKSRNDIKNIGALLTTLFGPTVVGGILVPLMVPDEYRCWTALAGTITGGAITEFAGGTIVNYFGNHFDKQSFSLACKKLVAEEKIEAVGAYLAYLASKDHEPLSRDQKNEIIRSTLESTVVYSFKIEQFEQERKTIATILDRVRNRKILSSISWQGAGYDESYLLQTNIEKLQS